jgi:small subunit ribosomal protein S14
MAKVSSIAKNERRKKLAAKQAPIRAKLRKMVIDESLSDEERFSAMVSLQKLDRNGNATRVRHRCAITGRSRGNYRKFGISRIKFREMAHQGLIPGVTKASW